MRRRVYPAERIYTRRTVEGIITEEISDSYRILDVPSHWLALAGQYLRSACQIFKRMRRGAVGGRHRA